MKNTSYELKNAGESINSRLEQAVERICKLEDRAFEIIHLEKKRVKNKNKNE